MYFCSSGFDQKALRKGLTKMSHMLNTYLTTLFRLWWKHYISLLEFNFHNARMSL
ncbi:hypothetical protein M6B38_312360 [Iris pallida]|uniref:Uncharacterized protein n=1 Tax=Iris pallida TaxID=29817 RepID=A0AAX6DTP2_IRIPA|nr:hypothetical protein M6B38_227055 [Iris pallida]KAJ6840036.1 hypothetical protein M6B38_312360 [Iris pallida]